MLLFWLKFTLSFCGWPVYKAVILQWQEQLALLERPNYAETKPPPDWIYLLAHIVAGRRWCLPDVPERRLRNSELQAARPPSGISRSCRPQQADVQSQPPERVVGLSGAAKHYQVDLDYLRTMAQYDFSSLSEELWPRPRRRDSLYTSKVDTYGLGLALFDELLCLYFPNFWRGTRTTNITLEAPALTFARLCLVGRHTLDLTPQGILSRL